VQHVDVLRLQHIHPDLIVAGDDVVDRNVAIGRLDRQPRTPAVSHHVSGDDRILDVVVEPDPWALVVRHEVASDKQPRRVRRLETARSPRPFGSSTGNTGCRARAATAALVLCVPLDVRNESSIIAVVDTMRHDTDANDVLINPAGADARGFGASADSRGPFDLDAEVFTAVLEANVTGPMLVSRHLLLPL